jgi:hypothetical protein
MISRVSNFGEVAATPIAEVLTVTWEVEQIYQTTRLKSEQVLRLLSKIPMSYQDFSQNE